MVEDWDMLYGSGRDYSVMNQYLLNEIIRKAMTKNNGSALDVGCGTGDLAVKLAQRGFTVTGTDLSPVAIKELKSVVVKSEPPVILTF
jgi:2-polyprenyl-3-methyl-5-hydroxy-6-metoxy-1,4-benzoquinol methylase